jgi:hypothetical protein
MKSLLFTILFLSLIVVSCDNGEKPSSQEFTGNQVVYSLNQASQYEISGTLTLREKIDGTALAEIFLTGTSGDLQHPVHLHAGDISLADAEVTAQLNPIDGRTGKSLTHVTMLADESVISYNDLKEFAGCIKIHLGASGPERDIILAAGNIGDLSTGSPGGRLSVGACKSE